MTSSSTAQAKCTIMLQAMIPDIVIDTDCGVDDTFCTANFVALHKAGKCRIRGVTTVCGNITTEAAYQNTRRLLREVLKVYDIPVFRSGCSEFNDKHCSFFYGQDGHKGALSCLSEDHYSGEIAEPTSEKFLEAVLSDTHTRPVSGNGLDWKKITPVTIVAIGPLTNLARVERRNPGLLNNASSIIVMGGAINDEGNCPKTNFASEYNFGMDGPSAHTVLASRNIVLFPLDLTAKIRFDMDLILKRSETLSEEQSNFIKSIVNGAFQSMVDYGEATKDDRRLNIHDVHCFVYYLRPDLYQVTNMKLTTDNDGVCVRCEEDAGRPTVGVALGVVDPLAVQEAAVGMFDILSSF